MSMNTWQELLMNDPDFVMEHAEAGFYHFNTALYDGPRSPSESMRTAERLAKRNEIARAEAAILIAREIDLSTSHESGDWTLETA